MLVTVIRSYSPEIVELPDGCLLRPFKFVEYVELPASMKSDPDWKEGDEQSGLQKLVDAGLVKVAQIQDIGHLMVQGSAENRLPQAVTGVYVPAPGAVTPDEQKRVEERDKNKPKEITENSRPAILSADEASRTAEYRPSTEELVASKVSIAQRARGVEVPADEPKRDKVRLAEGAAVRDREAAEGRAPVSAVTPRPAVLPTTPAAKPA